MRYHPLLLVSIVAGVLYYLTQPWHPFPGVTALKGLSVAPLALLAWRTLPGRDGLRLGLGLAFGSLGDVLLDWSADLFPLGLAAFLVGHFCYIALFSGNREKGAKLTLTTKGLLVFLGLFAAVMSFYLLPSTGSLAPAVVAYVSALIGMAACAVAMQLPENWVVIGALLFVMSDTILAVNKFRTPVPGHGWLIWPTYYLGQLLICAGILRFKSVWEGKVAR